MSNARERIFAAIARRKQAIPQPAFATPEAPLSAGNTIPASAQLTGAGLHAAFEQRVDASGASFELLESDADIPAAVARYLSAQGAPGQCFVNAAVAGLDWLSVPGLDIGCQAEDADRPVCIASAYKGIAETGSLVLTSAPGHSAASYFLAEYLIVILSRADIVATQESVWTHLRQHPGGMPRSVHLITGPSRTGDIEQKIVIGAHGPKRLHLLLRAA